MNKEAVLHYLNCFDDVDQKTHHLINECILEVQDVAHFKVISREFRLQHHPISIDELNLLLHSQDLEFYFQECEKCLVIACTLGIEIDRKIKYYEHIDMAKAIVFDAVSNRYLEERCDDYEKTLNLGQHTFRFAPGYGDLPLELNNSLSRVLQIDKKIGVSISSGGLLVPMKSMLGIIGIGVSVQKTCLSCVRKDNCILRKSGQRCYVKD